MGYEELEEQRDSRECIESDLLALTKKWHDYDGDFMKIYSSVAYAQVKELLDRQAALTERETKLRELYKFEENHRDHVRSIEEVNQRLNERIAELQDDNDRLQDVVALLRVAQVAHRETHMKLPLDADGVPIHMGDYLSSDEYNGERFVCMGLDVEVRGESEHWSVGKRLDADTGCVEYTAAHRCHHVKPRTVEDVLSEFRFKANCIYDDPNIGGEDMSDALESLDEECAAEIRELLRGDGA